MTEEIHETVATAPSFELSPEDKAKLAKIGPSEKIKHAAKPSRRKATGIS